MRIPHSWLLQFLSSPLTVQELEPLLTMGVAEVEAVEDVGGDPVLQLALKPDRGDCLSVQGVAREVCALAGMPFIEPAAHAPDLRLDVERSLSGQGTAGCVPIRIEDTNLCPRYVGCVIEGIAVGPSPEWLQLRIRQLGLRPVNNVVDATNLVLFETGQPLHAFDLDRLQGPAIVVRSAREGESLAAINGDDYTLTPRNLIIADSVHPVAIAGVMGGIESEVGESTTRLLIESAHFNPVSVRLTSRALGLKSDASYRFERGVDPTGCARAASRVVALILDIAGGHVAGPMGDVGVPIEEQWTVELRPARVCSLLGMDISSETMANCLRRLGLDVNLDGEILRVHVPARRPDLTIEADLAEEVARMVGYDRVPLTLPTTVTMPVPLSPERQATELVRDVLAGCGYSEMRSYSMSSPEVLRRGGDPRPASALKNPTSSDRTVLRTSLLPSILEASSTNLGYGFRSQHLFEVGRVFSPGEGSIRPVETVRVAGLAMGTAWRSAWNLSGAVTQSDFYSVRGVLENVASALRASLVFRASAQHPAMHPGRCAAVYLDGSETAIGFVGELHPEVEYEFPLTPIVFELDMAPLLDAYRREMRRPVDMEIYRLPSANRDLAVVVSQDVPAADLLASARAASPLISEAAIFDLYRGEGMPPGMQSIAISMVLRHRERTLTDMDANAAVDEVLRVLGERFGAVRR
jgi:phenylalanyl-tRNA synthetase beta chain